MNYCWWNVLGDMELGIHGLVLFDLMKVEVVGEWFKKSFLCFAVVYDSPLPF
jgi:hypothetical protein